MTTESAPAPHALPDLSEALAAEARTDRQEHDPFSAARRTARRVGARWAGSHAELGFWVPELLELGVRADHVHVEVLTPPADLDLKRTDQEVEVERHLLPVAQDGEYVWCAAGGLRPGSREVLGSLYQLTYTTVGADGRERRHVVTDPLAHSVPFGAFAPAELYDMAGLQAARTDTAYWRARAADARDGAPVRVPPPTSILQLHVPTATGKGTLEELAEQFRRLGDAQRAGTELPPELTILAGYGALQPLPLEPTIEYELGPRFVQRVDEGPADAPVQTLRVRRPDMTNWGYDILLAASSATNPRLLGTGRPDEVVDLVAALHGLPEPMLLVLDVVYGHTDSQALDLLSPTWFRGANMYGQDVNQQHPVVRAHVLEMQRRKVDLGADGVRVDGAQDFTTWDAIQQVVDHDDEFLELMAEVPQEVAGVTYRPWFVFEDGRPWPREDWPVASTYRAVIDRQPEAFQWGPITFANNTPALEGFWQERWWRVEQIFATGSHWVSGCANHDTVRRGTQIPLEAPVNPALGSTRPEILANAYDNPAAQLLTYAAFPGVPMDFLNATTRAPWAFVRNTDDRYGVKIVAEESRFLLWQMDEERWERLAAFPRLASLGIGDLTSARRTFSALETVVEAVGNDLASAAERLAALAGRLDGPVDSVAGLKQLARAYMDDVHDLCQVHRSLPDLDPARAAFSLGVRTFRAARPWLRGDLAPTDGYGSDESEGALLVHVVRRSPDGQETVGLVANLAGTPVQVVPSRLLGGAGQWRVSLCAPGVVTGSADDQVTLHDSQGLVLVR